MDITKIIDLVAEVAVRRTRSKKRENSDQADPQADLITLLEVIRTLQAFCEPRIFQTVGILG